MSYLKDSFQFAGEIDQNKKKLANTVEKQSRLLDALIRPSLTAEQNKNLSLILETVISTVAECSFQVGYNSALQTFSETAAVIDPIVISGQP